MDLLLIYCVWLWLVSLFYIADIYPFSPLLGLILGLIFTTINNLFNPNYKNMSKSRKYGVIIWEFFVLVAVLIKSKKLDIVHNLILFAIYQVYLFYNDTSFIDVYFNKLTSMYRRNPNDSLLEHMFRNINE